MRTMRVPLLLLCFLQVLILEGHLTNAVKPPLDLTRLVPDVPIRGADIPKAPKADPVIIVPGLGIARGTILTSFEGREFYGFMSIPYAEPPVEDLRFKYPEPYAGTWPEETDNGVYDASYMRARCPQNSMILDITSGREDCLHVSIYTPQLPSGNTKLPVMFWIHGGAYTMGDASLYVPSKLMDRNVIVVVVQYRLATFGFVAGGIPDAPGNMGLMDQIMALRWVQQHITHFGGDPNTVTVFGQSAGGASSSWMQITPLTGGAHNAGNQLFHRVIPQSGSALELWTIDPLPEEGFQLTAEILGCWNESIDSLQVVECMRTKSVDEINEASNTIYTMDMAQGGLGFKALCPVVQSDLALNDPEMEIVIPDYPRAMLANGSFLRVPMMAGTVRDEGSLVVGLAYEAFMVPNNHTTEDVDFIKYEVIPLFLKAFGLDDQTGAIGNSMRVAYLPNAQLGNWTAMVGGLVDMSGVMFLKSGLWEVVSLVNRAAKEIPIYFYSWEYESDDSLFYWIFSGDTSLPVPGGISHADELPYLFHLPAYQDAREKNMTKRMITMWTNFAKYGSPTPPDVTDPLERWEGDVPQWQPYDSENYHFMLMKDDFSMQSDFTTRWHHSRDIGESRTKDVCPVQVECPAAVPDYDSMVPREELEDALNSEHSFKVATGILGAMVGLVLVAAAVFAVFQLTIKKRRNGIV